MMPGVEMQPPDALVPDVANEQRAVAVEDDAVRLAQLGFDTRSAIAAESCDAGAGDRGDDLCLAIHLSDDVVVPFCDVQVARAVELDLVRHVQRRLDRRSAVARIPLFAIAGDRRHLLRLRIETANALVVEVAEIQSAVRAEDDAVRIVDLRVRIAGRACPEDRGDSLSRSAWCRERRSSQKEDDHSQGPSCHHSPSPFIAAGAAAAATPATRFRPRHRCAYGP
jgi:hypothetical protein